MFAVAPAFTARVVGEATSWYPGGWTTWVRDADAAIAPVYTVRDVVADPHVRDRAIIVEVDGVRMQGPYDGDLKTIRVVAE